MSEIAELLNFDIYRENKDDLRKTVHYHVDNEAFECIGQSLEEIKEKFEHEECDTGIAFQSKDGWSHIFILKPRDIGSEIAELLDFEILDKEIIDNVKRIYYYVDRQIMSLLFKSSQEICEKFELKEINGWATGASMIPFKDKSGWIYIFARL